MVCDEACLLGSGSDAVHPIGDASLIEWASKPGGVHEAGVAEPGAIPFGSIEDHATVDARSKKRTCFESDVESVVVNLTHRSFAFSAFSSVSEAVFSNSSSFFCNAPEPPPCGAL